MVSLSAIEETATVFSAGLFATFLGLVLAGINPFLLPLVQLLAVYPFYFKAIRRGELRYAALLVFLWAIAVSLAIIFATISQGSLVSDRIINGEAYVSEMFEWIRTGRGPEGDPSLFMIPKIREIAVFTALSVASVGLLGLFLGAVLLNYMNYYVGVLILHAKPVHLLSVVLLSWQIYALLRVVGYVLLGVALSRLSYIIIFHGRYTVEKDVKRLLLWSLIFIALDFLLKSTVANAFYQPLLQMFTNI